MAVRRCRLLAGTAAMGLAVLAVDWLGFALKNAPGVRPGAAEPAEPPCCLESPLIYI